MEKFAAIPTKYNGVQFRSRLEAKWAAFFGLCNWKSDYEAIDLNGWIPDFVLTGKNRITYVEVRPYTYVHEWRKEIFPKIKKTYPRIVCDELFELQEKSQDADLGFLLTNIAPHIVCQDCQKRRREFPNILLLGASLFEHPWQDGLFLGLVNRFDSWFEPANFFSTENPERYDFYCNRMYNSHHNNESHIFGYRWDDAGYLEDLELDRIYNNPYDARTLYAFWKEAGNIVQWKAPRTSYEQ